MTSANPLDRFVKAASRSEACDLIAAGATIFAGGTWIMRGPIRKERMPDRVVSLANIVELKSIEVRAAELVIGAAVTHEKLGLVLAGFPQLAGLRTAATKSANPAIRRVATIGGNLCTTAFAASDFAPALLSLNATVDFATTAGASSMPIAEFLQRRSDLLPGTLLVAVRVPLTVKLSAHERLPLRKAGDYPVAIVSVAAFGDDVYIGVGSVEPIARRWSSLEQALETAGGVGNDDIRALATAHNDFVGRDGIEAEGWYRREVLPALVARAFATLKPGEAR